MSERFADIISDINEVSNLTGKDAVLKRALNDFLAEYAGSWPWPHYEDRGFLTTVAPDTTGTVAVTNGSTTVTGTSTAFAALQVGRKLQVDGQLTWYVISAVGGATSITLQDPYQGDTDSGLSFSIFQDEYLLDADTHRLLDMVQTQNDVLMSAIPSLSLDRTLSDITGRSDPIFLSIIGREDSTYETGTIEMSQSGVTITGSSTVWSTVLGLGRGSKITVSGVTQVFTVRSVNSDTSITTYESANAAIASGTAYIAILNNIKVQVRDIPDAARNLHYRKHRFPAPLFNDNDLADIAPGYRRLLTDFGLSVAFQFKGVSFLNMVTFYEGKVRESIEKQKKEIGSLTSLTPAPRENMDRVFDAPLGGRAPGNFGFPILVNQGF